MLPPLSPPPYDKKACYLNIWKKLKSCAPLLIFFNDNPCKNLEMTFVFVIFVFIKQNIWGMCNCNRNSTLSPIKTNDILKIAIIITLLLNLFWKRSSMSTTFLEKSYFSRLKEQEQNKALRCCKSWNQLLKIFLLQCKYFPVTFVNFRGQIFDGTLARGWF